MKTRMLQLNRSQLLLFSFTLSVTLSSVAFSDTIEDRAATPTDGRALHPFQHNPAIVDLEKFGFVAVYDSTTKKSAMIGSKGTGNQADIEYERPTKIQALALQVPLGGAALVLSGQFKGDDLTGRTSARNRAITEYYRERRYEGRFALELVSKTKFAFAYKYHQVQQDIYGSFNLDSLDRTPYKGTMSGYSAGVFYEDSHLGAGLFHVAPMRGKSEIFGEQKIISYPGLTGFDGFYQLKSGVILGLSYKRWLYKADDRTELSTSPDDDRTISLGGLDVDQFFYRTQAIGVGADLTIVPDIELRLGVIRQDGVFQFADNVVPGDRPDDDKALQYQIYKAGIRIQKQKVGAEFMLVQSARLGDDIRDSRSVFGHGRYSDYEAKEQGAYIALSFQP